MAEPTLIGHVDGYGTGATARVITPHASTVVGDLMIVVFAANAQTITPPTGWTTLKAATDTGTLRTGVFAKFRETGDTTYSFTIAASATDTHSILTYRGVDTTIANLIVGGNGVRATNGTSTTSVAPAITTTNPDTMVVTIATERTTTTEANITSVSPGTADFFVAQNGATGLETISISHVDAVTPRTTTNVTVTYPQVQASNGFAFQLGIPAPVTADRAGTATFGGVGSLAATGVPAVTGDAVFVGTGTINASGITGDSILVPFTGTGTLAATGQPGVAGTATFTAAGSLSSSGRPAIAGTATLTGAGTLTAHPSTPVELFMAQPTMYAAHRGGSADWPEESLYSYAQSATWNADMALEISLWYTTDGVAVASHDQTTGRVFSGTSLDITTNTWATLSSKTTIIGNQPIAKVTDILDVHANGNRVIFVDNKGNQQQTAFYNMLTTYGGTSRFIIKAYGGSTSWAPTASSRGYKSWGYFFASDTAGLPGWAPLWTMLGQDHAAGSADWVAVKSYGKPVLAHIIGTAAQKATAATFNPQGYMASGVTEVVPQTPVRVALNGVGAFAASGTLGYKGAAVFAGVGALSGAGVTGYMGAIAYAGVGTMTVTGSIYSHDITATATIAPRQYVGTIAATTPAATITPRRWDAHIA